MQNGTPLFALQELGDWESPEMVRRYAHLASEHLAAYAGKVGMVAANDNRSPVTGANTLGTNSSQQLSS